MYHTLKQNFTVCIHGVASDYGVRATSQVGRI
jgi:hypothetical protein